MAGRTFIRFSGGRVQARGGSKHSRHRGWFDVEALDYGHQTLRTEPGDPTRTAGPSDTELRFTTPHGLGIAQLWEAFARAEPFTRAEIEIWTGTGKGACRRLRITCFNVRVVKVARELDRKGYVVTLWFNRVEFSPLVP